MTITKATFGRIMTAERMATIRQRVDAASSDPWSVGNDGDHYSIIVLSHKGEPHIICRSIGVKEQAKADLLFAAHARTDVPDLLNALEASVIRIQQLENELPLLHKEMVGLKSKAVWLEKKASNALNDVAKIKPSPKERCKGERQKRYRRAQN